MAAPPTRPIAEGQEGYIFEFNREGLGMWAVKVFKNTPSDEEIARFERISIALSLKDPTHEYFMTGRRITRTPRAEMSQIFDFRSCDELSTGATIYWTTMRFMTPYEPGRGIAHLRDGLALLHSRVRGEPMAHGDIKRDNIMVWNGNPVFIDFGLARFESEGFAEVSPERDARMFLERVARAPPPAPLRGPERRRREPSRSRSPGGA